jgi:hypothetical protein
VETLLIAVGLTVLFLPLVSMYAVLLAWAVMEWFNDR